MTSTATAARTSIDSTDPDAHPDCQLGYAWNGTRYSKATRNPDGTVQLADVYAVWGDREHFYCVNCDIRLDIDVDRAFG
jgi:hypothetical protein